VSHGYSLHQRKRPICSDLDKIMVFSRSDKEHYRHLRKVFSKCRRFGLSLNPKKSMFAMQEGKLLGHIVSAE
jgi:hypothetical protein